MTGPSPGGRGWSGEQSGFNPQMAQQAYGGLPNSAGGYGRGQQAPGGQQWGAQQQGAGGFGNIGVGNGFGGYQS